MPNTFIQSPSFIYVLLVVSILLICSVLSSKISSKIGVPTLLLFLGIGMLAGSEGPGGIDFTNYPLAYAIGSICLAIIIFDGGMRTDWKSVQPVLKTGISLSVFGTILTALFTGLFAYSIFNLNLAEAFLLGSIISSTDAAAVFSILKSRNLTLKGHLKKTLEFEAGSNDPIAVFLTVSVLTFITSPEAGIFIFLKLFVTQAILGLICGLFVGKGVQWLINNVGIEYEGLYSVLLLGLIFFLFSLTTLLEGSGFLAVYVAGLVLGNLKILHKESIIKFQDGIAWIAQITVFLTLGLLVFPSNLFEVWKEGLILALFLMFIARPLSVLIAGKGKFFSWREKTLVSWVGLRGVAPIILATLPWSTGFVKAEYFFNLVFFVVLITVLFQGMGIPWVANKLKVTEAADETSPLEISQDLLPAGFITIEINVTSGAPALDDRIVDLALPSGVLLTSLKRDGRFLIPKGDTVIMKGDRIRGLARASSLSELENVFGNAKIIS
ncbi:MAG: potassium/proton antiporter [Bacteriovoracia bacterium]